MVAKPKELIMSSSSPRQIGGVKGHMASEHIFSMFSVIALYKLMGKPLIAQLFDLVKFFDKEVLLDVMDMLYSEVGIVGRDYRNIYELNRKNRIRVRTGAGNSSYTDAGELLGQGSGGAACYSQKYLDVKVGMMFDGSTDEFRYGGVLGMPAIQMDDIFRAVGGVDAANAGNIKLDMMGSLCQLDYHPVKTCYIIMATESQKDLLRKEIETKPIMLGDITTKEKEAEKWLGVWLHSNGLEASIALTVEMREKKVKGAMFEAVAIVEDYRAQCLAGFETALQLWELAIIPSLLYSCGVWTEIPSKTLQKLEDLQLFFLRLILRVGPGTPKVALLAQTGMMKMKHRIWIEKVMMIVHIRGLNESALARQIWKEQREQNWPGLSKEVSQICEELGIPDVNESAMVDNKKSVRRMVKSACRSKNDIELKEKMDDLIKCDNMKGEDCDLKSYFKDLNLNDARNMFAINSNMN